MKITIREPTHGRCEEKRNKGKEKNPEGNTGRVEKILANRYYIFRSAHYEKQSDYTGLSAT